MCTEGCSLLTLKIKTNSTKLQQQKKRDCRAARILVLKQELYAHYHGDLGENAALKSIKIRREYF